jgi:23S rRNA (cytidine1920-2'-O)/16S rRNA (cytidine1409-2'-O)-methyltransferase
VNSRKKIPLDKLLVNQGHAPDLTSARAFIMAGDVVVDDHLVDKPGTPIVPDARVRLKTSHGRYVSRGGDKLILPLDVFQIAVQGKAIIDVGASTGGFTDCLLQHGAACVFAVDVGYGQLAWKLRQDRRVVVFERTNIRSLRPDMLEPAPDFAVIDASFVSLKGLLPPVMKLLPAQGCILALVKPQFEVGPGGVESGGIVRDERRYQEVFKTLISTVRSLGMHVAGILESPITGHKGNREFFIYLRLS